MRRLPAGEKPGVKLKYVHMWQKDYATWTAFLQSEWCEFEEVWYDVHVGRAMAVPVGAAWYMNQVAEGVSRKRIDVVGRMGKALYIIEVKPEANIKGVGQVVTYRDLFNKEFFWPGPVLGMMVATRCDCDILDTANKEGIEIIALEGVTL